MKKNKKMIVGIIAAAILLISIYLIVEPTQLKEERVTVKDISIEQNKCSLKTKFTLLI